MNGSSDKPRSLQERCVAIAMLVVDVDGVLTDGGIVYGSADLEHKRFHVRDGSGLKVWHQCGKVSALLTGRRSPVVDRRAAELGIGLVRQGAAEKLPAYRSLLAEAGVMTEAVCYIGDDLPDLPPLRTCGLAVAVADACAEVRADAHYTTRTPGGRGAVRETIELILRCQGHWQRLVHQLRGEALPPLSPCTQGERGAEGVCIRRKRPCGLPSGSCCWPSASCCSRWCTSSTRRPPWAASTRCRRCRSVTE